MTSGSKHGRRRYLTEEERVLWSTVTRAIVPLARPRSRDPRPEEASPPVEAVTAGPAMEQVRAPRPVIRPPPPPAPLDRRLKQRLARGSEPIDARVDLHGLTQAEAHGLLVRFVRNASAQGARVVLVITGKGGGAGPGGERGVLRRQVPHWLEAPELCDHVVGFAAAHVTHGGDGALYVRLRRQR
jgi:DNA-nicking Smr family endonuclease